MTGMLIGVALPMITWISYALWASHTVSRTGLALIWLAITVLIAAVVVRRRRRRAIRDLGRP